MKKEIVIAAYDKSLDWVSRLNEDVKVTIYRKGNVTQSSFEEIVFEPNVGRCVHSFFNHLYKNYDDLSDLTFFVQDYPFDHWENCVEIINDGIESVKNNVTLNINNGYFGFHYNSIGTMWPMYPSNDVGQGNILRCYSNGHPHDHNPNINVDMVWNELFDQSSPGMYEFIPGGHFGITKEHVHLRSKEYYGKVVNLLETNPTMPWMIERLECYIFNPKFK